MAYVEQTWETGETITAEKLNHMEDGIAAGGGGASYDLVLTANTPNDGDPTLTGSGLSFDEIAAKIENGDVVTIKYIATQPSQGNSSTNIVSDCNVSRTSETDYQMYIASGSANILEYSVTVYNGNKIESIIVNYCYWTYVYNSDTKEYTFTFANPVD